MLDGEAFWREPQSRLIARERFLPVKAPVPEACEAQGVQHPHEAAGEESAPELLLAVPNTRDEAKRGPRYTLGPLLLRTPPLLSVKRSVYGTHRPFRERSQAHSAGVLLDL